MRLGGLVVGGKLDRMVLRRFAAAYAAALVVVCALFIVLDLAANIDEFGHARPGGGMASSAEVVRYYLLGLPFLYLQVGPIVTLVAGLYTLVTMVRRNEWLAALSAGISGRRLLAPMLVLAAALAAAALALGDGEATEHLAALREEARYRLEEGAERLVAEDLWLIDRCGRTVHVDRFVERGAGGAPAHVEGLQSLFRAGDAWLRVRCESAAYERAADGGERWVPRVATLERLLGGVVESKPLATLESLDFTPHDLALAWKANERPGDLTLSEAARMTARDPDDVRYRTLLAGELAFPLANIALLLVGLPLVVVGGGRGVTRGLLLAVGMCLSYFALDFVARSLGMGGWLGPLVAGWLAVLLAGSLGLVSFGGLRT